MSGQAGFGIITQGTGAGSGEAISITKSAFLALVAAETLTAGATYNITDISGFESVYIDATSADTFNPDGSGLLIVPNYTPSGVNLGQMNFNDIPSVAAGEKVIWGDHYWANNTASPVTPTITDEITLDGLTQVSKTTANGYGTLQVEVQVDDLLRVSMIVVPSTVNFWKAFSTVSTDIDASYSYIYSPLNLTGNHNNDLTRVRNYYSYVATNDASLLLNAQTQAIVVNEIFNNSGAIYDLSLNGDQNQFSGNDAGAYGQFSTIKMANNSRFTNNIVTGAIDNDNNPGASYIELWDNCEVQDNTFSGDGAVLWDVRTGENSKVNNNTFSGDRFTLTDIDQMLFDEVNDNTFGSNDGTIEMINMLGYSKFNNNTIAQNDIRWSGFQMLRSEITGTNITSGTTGWRDVWMSNAKLQNATNIDITDCKFSDIILDLTGFAQDIDKESIEAGVGWFTINHNFATSPLTAGSSVLYNLIPTGARLTNCTIIPSSLTGGAGATLRVGLESDDVSYGLAATVLGSITNTVVNTVSNAATANRSLQLTAGIANITGGTVTVKVEFITA